MTTLEHLQKILMDSYPLERAQLTPEALLSSLDIDSLGVMELLFTVEDEFELKVPNDVQGLKTVGDVVKLIDDLREAQRAPDQHIANAASSGLAGADSQRKETVAARRLP
jgi:acyl carrier protein